jgi:hypothetical protein
MSEKAHEKKMFIIPGHKGNANQNYTKIFYLLPVRIAISKNTKNKCWQGYGGKKNTHTILVRMLVNHSMENSVEAP